MSYFPSGRNAGFALTTADIGLPNSRVLTAGQSIQLIDDGTNFTIATTASNAAPSDATYLVVSLNGTLTAERSLNVASPLTFTDNGANNTFDIGLGTVPINKGGTGQVTKTDAFDALSPTTTKGDVIVYDGTDNVRFAAGSNRQIVVYDSSTATGLRATFGAIVGARSVSADTTLVVTDESVTLVSAAAAARTITLPSAASSTNKIFITKKTDSSSNTVTIQRAGSDTIDGGTSFILKKQYDSVTMVCDGTNWYVI